MEIIVYGKKDCGKCDAAKDKLDRMGFSYEVRELSRFTSLHQGWRTDGSVDVMSASVYWDGTLPLLSIDGEFYDYPTAMRVLKPLRNQVPFEPVREAVLAS